MLARRSEADYEALTKRYEEILASHSQAITKLELAQDETNRLTKQLEEIGQERNNAKREIVNLRQQINVVHGKYDKAARDCIKCCEAYQRVQQQYEEAVKEVNQAMAFRMKASKEVKRLTDERNAAMEEYSLIMSERYVPRNICWYQTIFSKKFWTFLVLPVFPCLIIFQKFLFGPYFLIQISFINLLL